MQTYNLRNLLFIILIALSSNGYGFQFEAKPDFVKSLKGIEWVTIISNKPIVLEAIEGNNLIIPGYNEIEKEIKEFENTVNDTIGYFIYKENNSLIIKDQRKGFNSTTILLPEDQNIKVRSLELYNIYASNFKGEIDAKALKAGIITLKDCSGPNVINTNTGNIKIYYHDSQLSYPLSAISTMGKILVELPPDTKADVDLESGTTLIDSDFNIKGRSVKSIGEKIIGEINGGGAKIQLISSLSKVSLKISK